MHTRHTLRVSIGSNWEAVLQRVRPAPWEMVALASFLASVGSGWWALVSRPELISPFATAAVMLLVTFAGWYVWGYFTYLTDSVFFGGHADYRGTLSAFGRAYVFQALFFLTFTKPLDWLWGWVALYLTTAAWGVIGPRRLGMRAWQAVVAATMGMLLWLACLLILTLTLAQNSVILNVGAFLA